MTTPQPATLTLQIAEFLDELFRETTAHVVVLHDDQTVAVLQPGGRHLLVQVNRAELVVR